MLLPWLNVDVGDMTGKTVLITGGNSGLGYQTALEIARKGGRVIITGRSNERLSKACQKITSITQNKLVSFIVCDMSKLSNVEGLAKRFKDLQTPLHCLVLNAGGMFDDKKSLDDIEYNIAVNHLSHFYLTVLLLDILKQNVSRIVCVSSMLHLCAQFPDYDKLATTDPSSSLVGYANSKLANILFVRELGKKLVGTCVSVFIVHPGFSQTEALLDKTTGVFGFCSRMASNVVATTPAIGAQTQIYAATSIDLAHKDMSTTLIGPALFGPWAPQCNHFGNVLHPLYVNDGNARALWTWSCKMIKEKCGYDCVV